VPNIVFARVQRVQKVEEILNELTCLNLFSEYEGGQTHGMESQKGRGTGGLALWAALCLQGSRGFRKLGKH